MSGEAMTPVLCLNCGKARSEHHAGNGDAPWWCDDIFESDKHWLDGANIEQRTAKEIAAWIERTWPANRFIAVEILEGAWKDKP